MSENQSVAPGEKVMPEMRGYVMECCGCGLCHDFDFSIVKVLHEQDGAIWLDREFDSTGLRVVLSARIFNEGTDGTAIPFRPLRAGTRVGSKPERQDNPAAFSYSFDTSWPPTPKRKDAQRMVPESLLLDARAEVERLESELAGSIAQAERMMAYMITHDGAALYCSSAMRDAYSEEHHGRLRAEALAGENERDARRYRFLRNDGIALLLYEDIGLGPMYPSGDDLDSAIDAVGGRGET